MVAVIIIPIAKETRFNLGGDPFIPNAQFSLTQVRGRRRASFFFFLFIVRYCSQHPTTPLSDIARGNYRPFAPEALCIRTLSSSHTQRISPEVQLTYQSRCRHFQVRYLSVLLRLDGPLECRKGRFFHTHTPPP